MSYKVRIKGNIIASLIIDTIYIYKKNHKNTNPSSSTWQIFPPEKMSSIPVFLPRVIPILFPLRNRPSLFRHSGDGWICPWNLLAPLPPLLRPPIHRGEIFRVGIARCLGALGDVLWNCTVFGCITRCAVELHSVWVYYEMCCGIAQCLGVLGDVLWNCTVFGCIKRCAVQL